MFLSEIANQFKNNPVLLFIEIAGTLSAIIPAIIVSLMTDNAPFFLVYLLFFIASSSLCFTAFKQRNSRLVLLNGVYTIINIVGLFNSIVI